MDKNLRDNTKYIEGQLKEAIGQATGSEKLELEGKLQSMASEVSEEADKLKKKVVEKANDLLDNINQKPQ